MTLSASEVMTIAAARALRNTDICFVGIGMPSAACNLARLTHAPDITLIYESGTIATKPDVLPLSIGDGELCDTALTTVAVPEMFRYWLQGGRFTVGFLGGAQIDRFANLNTTVVGPYDKPKTRLPGGGGAPEISSACGEIFIIMRRSPRSFVEKLDFVTSFGHGEAGDQGDDGHLDPSGGDARGDQGQYRLVRALRRRCGRDARADRAGIVSVAGVARAHRARSRRRGVSGRRGTS